MLSLFSSSLSKSPVNSAILATLGAMCLSISTVLVKQLNDDMPTILLVFISSLFGLMFFLPIFMSNGKLVVKTHKLPLHILSVMLVVSSMLCTYYAYSNLPMTFATSIGMSSSLFVVALSVVILKESMSFLKFFVTGLGYMGVLMMVKPDGLFLDIAMVSALLANSFAACAMITAKMLSRYDSMFTMMLYNNVGITMMSFLLNVQKLQVMSQVLSLKDFILMSIMAILSLMSQFCSISALKYASPSFTAPFDYMSVLFATLVGITMFSEVPDFYTMLGSVMIMSSAYMTVFLDSSGKNS